MIPGGADGAYSNSAIAFLPKAAAKGSADERVRAVKIERAMLSGPAHVTRDATVAEMGKDGAMIVLREGTNGWTCFPGDENEVGNVPMCADAMGMQWMMDAMAKKSVPTNTAPGMIYMLCGATQHSNTDPADHSSPPIPIGPHWMVLWPFAAAAIGLPSTVRDAGAWIMFDGTPYAYLHVCGDPWAGTELRPGGRAVWTMRYDNPPEPAPTRDPW